MPTPEWWLSELASRMDDRRWRLALLRSYLDGDPPLPEGAENCRDAYKQFQRKARTNFAETVTDAVSDRMIVSNLMVGGANEDDDTARRFWRRNHLSVWSADVHRDMLGLSTGYVCVQPGSDGAQATYERPEQVIVDCDPRRPDLRRAGLKIIRDDVEGFDEAVLHVPGEMFTWRRDIPSVDGHRHPILTYSGGWIPHRADDTGVSRVPIVPFVNRGKISEFESHLDLLDRINWNVLQRLVIIAMQAYRQRATKGELPETDEAGNPIDYAEVFKPGPGALWQLPDGVDLWESAQTDITGILDSAVADLRALAAVTHTPMSQLVPDSANQSAEGAAFAREGLVFKTEDRINRAQVSWAEVIRLAYEIDEGVAPEEIEVQFRPPARQSMAERYDALTKARDDVPWRTRMTHILGFEGDMVDRMASQRAEDMMLTASLAAAGQDGADDGDE